MKKFLIKFGVFILPIIPFLFGLDYVVTEGLRKTGFGDYAEWNELFNGEINADLIINGSSQAWTGFSPKIFEENSNCSSYNLGLDGYNFHMEYYRYLSYEKHNLKPKYIIQQLDYTTLLKRETHFRTEQFLPYLDEEPLGEAALMYKGLNNWDKIIPFHRYLGKYSEITFVGIKEYFGIRHYPADRYKGFAPHDLTWNGAELEKLKSSGEQITVHFDKQSIALFRAFLKHCKDSKIKAFLVLPPLYKEGKAIIANYDEFTSFYQDLAKEFDSPLLDYSDSPISQDQRLFYNSTHLNRQGAERFSHELINDLVGKYGLEKCSTK